MDEQMKELVVKIVNCENSLYEEAFGLLIPIPENMFFYIRNMWDLFRLTDGECLLQFPENQHIKDRNPSLPLVNQELYDFIRILFRKLIRIPNERALVLEFANAECTNTLIYISKDKDITMADMKYSNKITLPEHNNPVVLCRIVSDF